MPTFDLSKVRPLRYPRGIDADGHILEPADLWETYLEERYRPRALRIAKDEDGLEYLEIGGAPSKMTKRGGLATVGRMGENEVEAFRPSSEKTYMATAPFGSMIAAERVKLIDAQGLDAVVLYPTLGILWEAELDDVELSQAYTRAYNRWIADFCRDGGGRIVPIAHLSLGDPEAAAAELHRAVKDGCRGAFVVPFTSSRKAHGDPVHDPVFRAAEELDVPLAIHPSFEPLALRSQRFENAHRMTLLDFVTAADGVRHAFTTLFDFAVFDRFPKLKIVILESGGGWIGYWLDRLDAMHETAYIERRSRKKLKLKPSEYFRRQCYISCDPDERTIPVMMQLYGADRFFWASDYPHPDHTGDYLAELEKGVFGMPEDQRALYLGENVRRAYGI